jgi:hypothetical protein
MATRRERERREWLYRQAKQRAREAERSIDHTLDQPANPSEHGILSLDDLLKTQPVPEIVVYDKVSTRGQSLTARMEATCRRIEARGVRVAATFGSKQESGKTLDPAQRPELIKARDEALERGCPVLAPAFSRFARNRDYHAYFNADARPTVAEVKALVKLMKGVQLVTLNDPDAAPPDDEAFFRVLKAEATGGRIGRPPKAETDLGRRARRKLKCEPQILKLRRKGLSYREIARKLAQESRVRVSHITVRKWIKTHENRC